MSHLDEVLSAYLDGEATPAESRRVNHHLAECERCRRRLTDLNLARTAIRSLPTLEQPWSPIPEKNRPAPVRRRSVWVGAAAAVAAAVITVATIVTPAPEPLSLSEVSRQFGARASLDPGSASVKVVAPPPGVRE